MLTTCRYPGRSIEIAVVYIETLLAELCPRVMGRNNIGRLPNMNVQSSFAFLDQDFCHGQLTSQSWQSAPKITPHATATTRHDHSHAKPYQIRPRKSCQKRALSCVGWQKREESKQEIKDGFNAECANAGGLQTHYHRSSSASLQCSCKQTG